MEQSRDEMLAVLYCEMEKRPARAPTFDDLRGYLQGMTHTDSAIVLDFPAGVRQDLEAFATAESLCCPEIGWSVDSEPSLRLTISAAPAQLDLLCRLWESEASD